MTKIRPEALVETWAKRPDVFELEPKHVRARFAAQVEAERRKLEAAQTPDPVEEKPEPKPKKVPAKKKTPAKTAEPKGE